MQIQTLTISPNQIFWNLCLAPLPSPVLVFSSATSSPLLSLSLLAIFLSADFLPVGFLQFFHLFLHCSSVMPQPTYLAIFAQSRLYLSFALKNLRDCSVNVINNI